LREAFKFFDSDGCGHISINDFRRILGNFDDQVWQRLIKGVDKNKDGLIDFSEFKQMMTEMN
jgi:calcium-dependent protein kinase